MERTPGVSGEAGTGSGPARAGLLVLMLSVFACVATENSPVGLLPTMAADLQVSEPLMGLVVSLYAALVALFAVPIVLATRAVPGKRLLLIATGCFALSNLVSAVAPTFAVLAAARALGGVTHALFFSVCIGYSARLAPAGHTGRALALVSAGASAGFAFGAPLATVLGNAAGWRAAFLALAVLMIVAFVLIAVLLPDIRQSVGESRHGGGIRRQLAPALGSNGLVFLGHYTLYTYVAVLLLRSGASPGAVGPILLTFGALALVGIWLTGPQIDRRPRHSALAVLTVLGVGMLATGFSTPLLGAVIFAGALWNGAFGAVPAVFQAAAVRTGATSPELAGAWVNATSNMGIAAGSAVGAFTLERFDLPGLVTAAMIFVGLAIATVAAARRTFPARSQLDAGSVP